jgi:hypothetical protein
MNAKYYHPPGKVATFLLLRSENGKIIQGTGWYASTENKNGRISILYKRKANVRMTITGDKSKNDLNSRI